MVGDGELEAESAAASDGGTGDSRAGAKWPAVIDMATDPSLSGNAT